MVQVEVVYVDANQKTFHTKLQLSNNSTVLDALEHSGIYQHYPETLAYEVGIFSKIVPVSTLLPQDARVEIYRPLIQDPKEKRRQRAKKR
jgi:uncharacterized protein